MKKIILSVASFVSMLAPLSVQAAEAVCRSNGVVVPCPEIFNNISNSAGAFVWVFFIIWGFMMLLGVASIVLWIVMLIHAATKDIENKVMWIIIICLTQGLGALIYYFVVKRPYDAAHPKMPAAAPQNPTTPPPTSSSSVPPTQM